MTALVKLIMPVETQQGLVMNTISVHASGPIPSQWIVDKKRLKMASASLEADELTQKADTFLDCVNAELARLRKLMNSESEKLN